MLMNVGFENRVAHVAALRRGLARLGPTYLAKICYWCDGYTGIYSEGHCHVCGDGKPYGTALGLLIDGKPAPESVVNQVLIAGEST